MSIPRQALVPGAGIQAARTLLLVPVRLLQTPLGRRVMIAGALTLSLQGVVAGIYQHADAPDGTARTVAAQVAAGQVGAPPAPAARSARATAAPTPEAAATAWYARHLKVAAGKVRALQRESQGRGRMRVLVMADRGSSRLTTALVTVARGEDGWTVR
ncbi:MAG TPA: hypothetical protein VKG45_11520 [Actinomycetes bacterium]|nr:hypothetical protein [Actinomycetes bacterium]